MDKTSYLKDMEFLKMLDSYPNKFYWVKIEVLNTAENVISNIEGRVQVGSSISINGNSSVRRTCTLNFIAEETENDLTQIDNLLSLNKKIRIKVGIRNDIDKYHDPIIWFPQGIFVICQVNISHSATGCFISLSCKDKMCLLNGEMGGGLPTSVTFDEYNQRVGMMELEDDPETIYQQEYFDWLNSNNTEEFTPGFVPNEYTIYKWTKNNIIYYKEWSLKKGFNELTAQAAAKKKNEVVPIKQRLYDIILTAVANYGGEDIARIMINDLPLQIKQICHYTGTAPLYYNRSTGQYTLRGKYAEQEEGIWREFNYGDDMGYMYIDFVYHSSLDAGIGDNVCSVLDKIKSYLGNYEYFYDINGNFVFQEIKNYLNNSYTGIIKEEGILDLNLLNNSQSAELNQDGKEYYVKLNPNNLCLLKEVNYKMDLRSGSRSVYTFNTDDGLVIGYNNSPNYSNIKNDFHVWGETDGGRAIHYHLAIKNKPTYMNTYPVIYLKGNDGLYTGQLRLTNFKEDAKIKEIESDQNIKDKKAAIQAVYPDFDYYVPSDWRAELYCQGLDNNKLQIRPDIYQQELLDLFDDIYNMKQKEFKADIVESPNKLEYFFDYLEPVDNLYNCSVDVVGTKVMSYQNDKIYRLFNVEVPNFIMLYSKMDSVSRGLHEVELFEKGENIANLVDEKILDSVATSTIGYTAQEEMRTLLYQYTNYQESISIQCAPIYYIEPNSRITVRDIKSGIAGDFIINNISLPLDAGGTMTISAIRALERI